MQNSFKVSLQAEPQATTTTGSVKGNKCFQYLGQGPGNDGLPIQRGSTDPAHTQAGGKLTNGTRNLGAKVEPPGMVRPARAESE
jgi:hypothetical protein